MRDLQPRVNDLGLAKFVNQRTPVTEIAWVSPASQPNPLSRQYLFDGSVKHTADTDALTVDALIPTNQPGSHLDVIAPFRLYFDDLLPNSLGKPIVSGRQ